LIRVYLWLKKFVSIREIRVSPFFPSGLAFVPSCEFPKKFVNLRLTPKTGHNLTECLAPAPTAGRMNRMTFACFPVPPLCLGASVVGFYHRDTETPRHRERAAGVIQDLACFFQSCKSRSSCLPASCLVSGSVLIRVYLWLKKFVSIREIRVSPFFPSGLVFVPSCEFPKKFVNLRLTPKTGHNLSECLAPAPTAGRMNRMTPACFPVPPLCLCASVVWFYHRDTETQRKSCRGDPRPRLLFRIL